MGTGMSHCARGQLLCNSAGQEEEGTVMYVGYMFSYKVLPDASHQAISFSGLL